MGETIVESRLRKARYASLGVTASDYQALSRDAVFKDVIAQLQHPRTNPCARLLPEVDYTVTFYRVDDDVTAAECSLFITNRHGIFIGWEGLLLLRLVAGDLFPEDAWVLSFDDWSVPLHRRDGQQCVLALQRAPSRWLHARMVTKHRFHAGLYFLLVTER